MQHTCTFLSSVTKINGNSENLHESLVFFIFYLSFSFFFFFYIHHDILLF